MNPLVSIIIPVYNSEKYLALSISSALNQTYANIEIIVIDDGSTDNSLTVAKAFENEKVKVFHQENKGAAAARNKGMMEAGGEYIQYLDADDLISSNKIYDQMILLRKKPGYICTCPTVYFIDGKDFSNKKPEDHWVKEGSDDPVDFLIKLYGGEHIGLGYGGMVTVHSWLCPRAVLDKAGSWNEELSVDDDGEYFCRVVLASAGILHEPESLSYYRKFTTNNSLSTLKDDKTYLSLLRSTELKAKNLLASTNRFDAKIALSRLFWDNTFTLYPRYKELAIAAEEKARELDPLYYFQPFKVGFKSVLSKLLGWKTVRTLQFLNTKITAAN